MDIFIRRINERIRGRQIKGNRLVGIAVLMLCAGFLGCEAKVGSAHTAKRRITASQIFTEEEIGGAMDAVSRYFELHFKNCTLTDIWYVGDERNQELLTGDAEQGGDRREMFICTNFNINSSDGVYATCNNWKWVVYYGRVWRTPGDWHVLKNGYGEEWLEYSKIHEILYDAYHGITDYDVIFGEGVSSVRFREGGRLITHRGRVL